MVSLVLSPIVKPGASVCLAKASSPFKSIDYGNMDHDEIMGIVKCLGHWKQVQRLPSMQTQVDKTTAFKKRLGKSQKKCG